MTVLTSSQLAEAQRLFQIGRSAGLTPQHASEFVAAAYSESGLNPHAVNPSSKAAGDFQLLSPGYVDKANAMGGVFNTDANARAILPDYKSYWNSHPDAAPGEAGAAVERSGEGAGFYAKGLPLLKSLAGGAVAAPPGLGAPAAAPGSPMRNFALQMIKQSQALEHGQPWDVTPALGALHGAPTDALTATPGPSPSPFTAGQGTVIVSPHANRPDMPLQPLTLAFVRQISHVAGEPLTIGTGTNHNQYVLGTNRESEHWTGKAADIPASGAALTKLGQDALIAAGMAPARARNEQGGVYNLTVGNHRVQIIFNSNVGGDHYNHLHVGIA